MNAPLRKDQLAPGQHVKDMGGGWVILSAEFLAWGASYSSPPLRTIAAPGPVAPKRAPK